MATWRKRGNSYVADFYERVDGALVRVRRVIDAETDEQAEKIVRDLRAHQGAGRTLTVPGSPTLGELFDRWLEDKRAKREPATAAGYAKHVRHFRRLLPMSMRAGEVLPEHIDDYLAARMRGTKGWGRISAVTANKERQTLCTAFRWAVKRRLIPSNPVEAVEPFAARSTPGAACPVEVYESLCAALEHEIARRRHRDGRAVSDLGVVVRRLALDVVRVIWATGMRIGEITRLATASVRLDPDWSCDVIAARNKGPAVMPIPEEVREIFERRADLGLERIFGASDVRSTYGRLFRWWSKWLKSYPEHGPAHFHALRHAFQRRLEVAGVHETVIQRLMRHRTLGMHAHYSHRDLPELREAIRRSSA